MTERIEWKNAIVTGARIDRERGLSAWLTLDYGDSCQGFGGYLLYAPEGWKAHGDKTNYCGHFIHRILDVCGVESWDKIVGKTIRVKASWNGVKAIGHIVKDDWFEPSEEFQKVKIEQHREGQGDE